MKYFRMSYEEVVFRRSFINILLLNRSIPSFNIDKDTDKEPQRDHSRNKRNVPKHKPRNESEFFMQFM